ncbi:PQQ-dependent dehydrogenase, methanol/ethanol family [Bryobacter aggregatus]|uniref:PQQ-dependent dehydrogenase, methanol/ethanol family n=1 Tax=Bryobacter aggregatus TaxID=360054 RepID=UPI000690DB5E|nr:PQQ-dependent dehydrogenase, methanol/ethanol family [Bryobacter aggregatus]
MFPALSRRLAAACFSLTVLVGQEHTPQNEKNPLAADATAVESGKKLFGQACQACHGGNAAGSDRGPALATGIFKHGAKDGEIFLNIRNGITGTQMPAFQKLGITEAWQIVSYLRSLSSSTVKVNETVPGDPKKGEALYFGKASCFRCHEVNGRGGIVAPDLSAAAGTPAEALKNKILKPNELIGGQKGPGMIEVVTAEGKTITGLRRNEDSFVVQISERDGSFHMLDKASLKSRKTIETSMMPANYATRLSGEEIQDIVAYLKTLTARDYAATVRGDLPAGGLSYERIRNASKEPQNWLTYWGDYAGKHFSQLQQITPANVKQLQAKWSVQMPGDSILETTPIVIDGIMYTAGMPGQVFALDARTGMQIWKYQRTQKKVNAFESNRYNRGVAVLGNRVFFGTLDAALVALDRRTGRPLWETQVADTMEGYSVTVAPLVVKDKVIVGVAGGEHGIRGFLDAYDVVTGKRVWRFNTVPGPGEFGHETWKGDSWKLGGAPTWLTGSYDAELDTLYWATGNPGPDMDAEIRKGDNLFSCSVLALDPATGKRKWHYQFTPNDSHDWDANQDLVLVDRVIDGVQRKLLVQTNRNGIFYVLDRTNGKLLFGKPYVRQTWNAGFEADGRPKVIPNTDSTPEGRVVYPTLVGGTNWQSPSFDSSNGMLYTVYADGAERFIREKSVYEPGKAYWGGRSVATGDKPLAGIKAIDTATGDVKWEHPLSRGSLAAGVLATSTGVLFSATAEGNLIALEAATGKYLWRMQTGATTATSPISYAVDGKQYVAIAAGQVLYSFALPE